MQYVIDIPHQTVEDNVLAFFKREGIKYLKLENIFKEKVDKSTIETVNDNKIILAEEDGDITMLFGKWTDINIEPENYRREI